MALVGLDDEVRKDPRSSVVFKVYGDVREMGEEPSLLAESPPLCDDTLRSWCFDVQLDDRVRRLRLVVTDAGDGQAAMGGVTLKCAGRVAVSEAVHDGWGIDVRASDELTGSVQKVVPGLAPTGSYTVTAEAFRGEEMVASDSFIVVVE